MHCASASGCRVDYQSSSGWTINWSASSKLNEWISGGFGVSRSWTTGQSYGCNGQRGETVCVWHSFAHTAYTVRDYNLICGIKTYSGGNHVISSPNNDNKGGGFYCVVGARYCRSLGEGYWDRNGRAGGP